MVPRIRIGNQTSIVCPDPLEPFHFALDHGFDAFEWFEDRKEISGHRVGWDESDMGAETRARLSEIGMERDVLFTVHAPWQANPLYPEGIDALMRSIAFAHDVGATLVNLHLSSEEGPGSFARALLPVAKAAATAGLLLSIENTVHTTPGDFNRVFERLNDLDGVSPSMFGMCLDIGHANLCSETHNNYIGYLDQLGPQVPVIHVHAHENYGDADRHLTLFTGPSRENDGGIRSLAQRLRDRRYHGAIILEQWPSPPTLLTEAATRLRGLLEQ